MQLFLDTADQTQWQTWLPMGLFIGITTNPTLLEQAQVVCRVERLRALAQKGFELGAEEIQLQTWGTDLDNLVQTGKALAAIDRRVVVKVPITQIGCTAANKLKAEGIRVTLTGVYAHHQVLIAAALGVDYAAPYLGRISDLGGNGPEELVAMQQSLDGVDSCTRLLVASVRTIDQMAFLTTQGLNTFTISPAIATALFDVPATDQAIAAFEQAAVRMGEGH